MRWIVIGLMVACLMPSWALGADQAYQLRPGDKLWVSVWGDAALNAEVSVLPDGRITFPLVGDLPVAGQSVAAVRTELTRRLSDFVSEPEVSVIVLGTLGSQIYVLGNVNKPGAFPMQATLTVARALALAGGLNPFADTEDIRILRGEGSEQRTLRVNYDQLLSGSDLSSNHVLVAGDTVLVP